MRRVTLEQDQLGECPTWDARSGRFFWIDVTGKKLLSCSPDGTSREELCVDDYPGSFALRETGGRLVAFRRKIAILDDAGNEIARAATDVVEFGKERFTCFTRHEDKRFFVHGAAELVGLGGFVVP